MSKASMRTKLAALETLTATKQWKGVICVPALQGQDLTINHVEIAPGVYRSRHHTNGPLVYTNFDQASAYIATLEDTHSCLYRVLSVAECDAIRTQLIKEC